jgi:hypothetical protein
MEQQCFLRLLLFALQQAALLPELRPAETFGHPLTIRFIDTHRAIFYCAFTWRLLLTQAFIKKGAGVSHKTIPDKNWLPSGSAQLDAPPTLLLWPVHTIPKLLIAI